MSCTITESNPLAARIASEFFVECPPGCLPMDTEKRLERIIEANLAKQNDTIKRAYDVLADFRHNWPGRGTIEGQRLLVNLLFCVSEATGQEPQEIRDSAKAYFVRDTLDRIQEAASNIQK